MNKSNPKVSILMCVYNGETYLRKAVESILGQTFKDFEFVIVDDGSTDSSWHILTEYCNQDARIVLIQNEDNLGLEKSLNKGIAATKGKYLARQDADDISLPNRLQLQVDFLDAHPEVGALGSAVEFIDRNDTVLEQYLLSTDHEGLHAYLLVNCCLWHSSMTMRRDLLLQLGGYNEEMRHAEDYDLWWRFSRISRLATLPEICLQYRKDNPAAITKLKRKQQLLCSQKISWRAIQESLSAQAANLDEKAYERFWWAYLEQLDPQSYQQWWYNNLGQEALLRWQDIQLLQPFWDLLSNHPAGARIWGIRLSKLALHYLRSRQTLVGIRLLWVSWRQLEMPISWILAFRSLLKPYLPSPLRQLWIILRVQKQRYKFIF